MKNTKFNEEELETIKQFYNSRRRSVCCSNPKLTFLEDIVHIPTARNETNDLEGFATVCENCGQTKVFNLNVMQNAKF